jgi:hypothetical protein
MFSGLEWSRQARIDRETEEAVAVLCEQGEYIRARRTLMLQGTVRKLE